MEGNMAVTVREIEPSDRQAWGALFNGYRDFYKKEDDPSVVESVWAWLLDPWHEVRGLVAEVNGEVVGIGHFRTFARPVAGAVGVWVDDLFTDESARGQGVGTAILERVAEIAADEGATVVRWITASDNVTAQRMYEKISHRTDWVVYDKEPQWSDGA
jgi:GNAT superfamily N-acetyltransferase